MGNCLIDKMAPDFKMNAVSGDGKKIFEVSLNSYAGKWLILFFYALDFTFICPTEIEAFSALNKDLKQMNTEILGVSVDSIYSHKAWITSSENALGTINFPLASDINKTVSKDYDVFCEEEGISLRGLFIIDPRGVLKYQVVHSLEIGRNTEEIFRVLKGLQSGDLCTANWNPNSSNENSIQENNIFNKKVSTVRFK